MAQINAAYQIRIRVAIRELNGLKKRRGLSRNEASLLCQFERLVLEQGVR